MVTHDAAGYAYDTGPRDWRQAPWTLWGLLVLTIVSLFLIPTLEGVYPTHVAVATLGSAIVLVGLFRGNRGAWLYAAITSLPSVLAATLFAIMGPGNALIAAVVVLDAYLIFHPRTRAWRRAPTPPHDPVLEYLERTEFRT